MGQRMKALAVFSPEQAETAKLLLAAQVAWMMGRKFEEGDWIKVYCRAKGIPEGGWSNLHIDVSYQGLGVEIKMLRVTGQLRENTIKSVCGTTLMHPAATRSIRIHGARASAKSVMQDVLRQYGELISQRTEFVGRESGERKPDMRNGWLLWEDSLSECLYFEEPMVTPDAGKFFAEWNETPARGARKSSRSLWIYERRTNKKRYSVTTSAGIKIQPYFDVPAPNDPNLYYFRVQGEPLSDGTVRMWVTYSTAQALEFRVGSLSRDMLDAAIRNVVAVAPSITQVTDVGQDVAVPVVVSGTSYEALRKLWAAVSDEHRMQLLLKSLQP
jgi:hypothetical protein